MFWYKLACSEIKRSCSRAHTQSEAEFDGKLFGFNLNRDVTEKYTIRDLVDFDLYFVKDAFFFRIINTCGESSGKEDVEDSRNVKTVTLKWIRGKNKQDKKC